MSRLIFESDKKQKRKLGKFVPIGIRDAPTVKAWDGTAKNTTKSLWRKRVHVR